jgi:hypothetical protein
MMIAHTGRFRQTRKKKNLESHGASTRAVKHLRLCQRQNRSRHTFPCDMRLFSKVSTMTFFVTNKRSSRRAHRFAALSLIVAGGVACVVAAPFSHAAPAPQNAKSQQVTAALTRFLRKKLSSPNGSLRLVIKPGARADAGYFSEVAIYGKPALLKKRVPISEISMRATNVHISPSMLLRESGRDLITLSSKTSLRAIVTESDLTQMFARGKSTSAMGLTVKFLGDKMRVSGTMKMGWLNGPVVAVGRLRAGTDRVIYIDLLSLKLNGVEAPAGMRAQFSDRLNPLISSDDIPFKPVFKALKFDGPRAIITAG